MPHNRLPLSYFEARGVKPSLYDDYTVPPHLRGELPQDKASPILDIGCGYGQTLKALRRLGFTAVSGVDTCEDAIKHAQLEQLHVHLINDLTTFLASGSATYNLVLMCHVIEHLPKTDIIDTLRLIKDSILKRGGRLYITTPNAQAATGCYWAYEDFTHTTLFTSGSILYVLRLAGYEHVSFLDPAGVEHLGPWKRWAKLGLQSLYRVNAKAWRRIMDTTYHQQSQEVFAWELRVIAY
jgi:SAM-dependent methyltransferase